MFTSSKVLTSDIHKVTQHFFMSNWEVSLLFFVHGKRQNRFLWRSLLLSFWKIVFLQQDARPPFQNTFPPYLQFRFFSPLSQAYLSSSTWQAHRIGCVQVSSWLDSEGRPTFRPRRRFLMFNSVRNLFLSRFPTDSSLGELEWRWSVLWVLVGPLCPSPSTFASVEHSIYFIGALHSIGLTSGSP